MIILQDPQISYFSECSYIPDELWRYEYFFALQLDGDELEEFLSKGWRKFGAYYFRPKCGGCTKCIPLRVLVNEFKPSRSQRRVLRKGADIRVEFAPLKYRDDVYEIYSDHSLNRFNRETEKEEFISTFYTESCPSLQSEYYLNGRLIAVGFLDISSRSLSSVYFIYKTEFEDYSPGVLSVISEIEYARSIGLEYYYLGYYINENRSMSYKNRFHPHELFDWESKKWISSGAHLCSGEGDRG